jgi:radical SAM protein with 4Fe4S-binding SPASM domain
MTAVWEVTMGCNMRCGHCGSSCAQALPDELTTEEALSLADEIAGLGLKWITLSGGEPLTRADLPKLIERLSSHSIAVNVITNGWALSRDMARILKESGISTVAISVDGTERIHDEIRCKGSFARIREAYKHLKEQGIKIGAVTTISNKNIDDLGELYETLCEMGVQSWQLQLGLPMGNFKEHQDWVVLPEKMDDIINFCYRICMYGKITVFPADCIGYYTDKEDYIRRSAYKSRAGCWDGCNAGIRGFGILHNGDILGCTSIRDKQFIEGNIRNRRLHEIWNDPQCFTWRRNMTKQDLSGDCKICTYGSKCLGGCPNTRLTMNGDICSENLYCSYNLALKRMKADLERNNDAAQLLDEAKVNLRANKFQEAALESARALELDPNNKDILGVLGHAEFMCGNYTLCEEVNRKALELDPGDVYAMKGLGLALYKQGDAMQGEALLEQAARMTNYANSDIIHDLMIVKLRV